MLDPRILNNNNNKRNVNASFILQTFIECQPSNRHNGDSESVGINEQQQKVPNLEGQ